MKTTRTTIVTVEKSGKIRRWGPLSRTTAWRAGSFWENMDRDVTIFIVED